MTNRNPRVLVCGSRDFEDPSVVVEFLTNEVWESWQEHWTLVHGACPKGPDAWANALADGMGVPCEPHPADWNTHGKKAGFIRNAEMVATLDPAMGDRVVAFWDGQSKGTKHTIDLALKARINTVVIFQ